MEKTKQEKQKLRWHIAGALTVPFIVMSVYLGLTRWPSEKFTVYGDYIGLGFSVLIGVVFIARLPISINKRVIAVLAYIPVFILALIYYSLVFVCSLFGACL